MPTIVSSATDTEETVLDFSTLSTNVLWPAALLIAWLAGEIGYRYVNIPRISVYAIVGFLLGPTQAGFLAAGQTAAMLLPANIAFGLILFECGYRINVRWAKANPWIVATSIVEAGLTFAAVWLLMRAGGLAATPALLIAALSMATSPATILAVVNERRGSGQVTERVLHISAMTCVLAVFVFKIVIGLTVFRTSGNLIEASYAGLLDIVASATLGLAFGGIGPWLAGLTRRTGRDATLPYAIAVILLVALAHGLKLSPILAALTFGIAARHGRIVLGSSQRGFGTLGSLLSVLLFVFTAATLQWHQVVAGFGLGLGIVALRQLAKIAGNVVFARVGGLSWRKGIYTSLAGAPISVFVILILEQNRYLGIGLVDQLAPLAMAALTMEIAGPLIVQRALAGAKEFP